MQYSDLFIFVNEHVSAKPVTPLQRYPPGHRHNPFRSDDGSAGLIASIKKLTPTKRTIVFGSGYYVTERKLTLNFADLLSHLSTEDQNAIKKGVTFLGQAGTEILINEDKELKDGSIGILFRWPGADLFNWKFKSLSFGGKVRNSLIQFGMNENDTPLNHCSFDISVNNGLSHKLARGITIFRLLDSKMRIMATSAMGMACVLHSCEFSKIEGSFSNSQVKEGADLILYGIKEGLGIHLENCHSLLFPMTNLEVCYHGIRFAKNTKFIKFGVVCVNNGDEDGIVLDCEFLTHGNADSITIDMLHLRGTAQKRSDCYQVFNRKSRFNPRILIPRRVESQKRT